MFRYRADVIPVSLIVSLFLLDVAVFWFAPWWAALVWAVAGLLPKACICAWNHHHQHVPTFRRRTLNRLLEVVYAYQTGALPLAWELHHNAGHHVNYLDQRKDESRWMRPDGSTMGAHEYSFNVFATAYPRIWAKAQGHARKRRSFLLWASVVAIGLLVAVVLHPINALIVFVMPMVVGLYVTAWHTYYHHAGLHSDDPYAASYNIIHRGYNILTGNLGYHTAHHLRCSVHWSELPELHASIAHQIPVALYRRPCFPFTLLGPAWFPEAAEGAQSRPAEGGARPAGPQSRPAPAK
jgi:fatty acid desaturase